MRLFRTLLLFLALALGLAGLFVAAAFNPSIQTWAVQDWLLGRTLARFPGVHGSVGAVSAGLHELDLTDLKLERGDVVLTVPHLRARLPVVTALWSGRVLLQNLVAKGWTLELNAPAGSSSADADPAQASVPTGSGPARPSPAQAPASQVTGTARNLERWLGWQWPFDGSVETADLEGDISATAPDGAPIRVHALIQGGGLAAGRTAKFSVTLSPAPAGLPVQISRVRGNLAMALTSARVVSTANFDGMVMPVGGARGAHVTASASGLDAPGRQAIRVDAERNGRRLAAIAATCTDQDGRLAGTWALDLRETEVARLWPEPPVRVHALAGNGTFETDAAFKAVAATGALRVVASRFAGFAPWLSRVRPLGFDTTFKATWTGGSLRFERANGTVVEPTDAEPAGGGDGGRRRVLATVTARQPFTISASPWRAASMHPGADWLDVSLHDWPLAWLPQMPGGVALASGELTGDFTMVGSADGIGLRPRTPFTAREVTLRRGGRPLASGLDLSLALQADDTPAHGWTFTAKPLTVARAGRELARVEATLSLKPDDYGRVPLTGTWTANLDAIRQAGHWPLAAWMNAATGSGSFTANIGTAADLIGKVTLVGHDGSHVVTANLSGSMDDYRAGTFDIPVQIAVDGPGAQVEFTGSWVGESGGPRIDLQVSSPRLTLGQAKWLATAVPPLRTVLAAAETGAFERPAGRVVRGEGTPPTAGQDDSMPLAARAARRASPRDGAAAAVRPFWGAATGRIRFDVQRVIAAKAEWDGLGGTVELQHGYLALHGGRLVYNPILPQKYDAAHVTQRDVEPRSAIGLEGKISFDPDATEPYQLAASGTVDTLDAVRVLGAPPEDEQPAIEGRFAVADTITSAGDNLPDLLARRSDEFHLTSDAGTVRLLKTNVAAALPNPPTPVADTFASVGSAVSALFGHKTGAGNVKLAPKTDAVLNFSYDVAEIGFDRLSATAVRDPDGTIEIRDISIRGPHAHLTGSGRIAAAPSTLGFAQRPLRLSLRLAVDGISARRLATAGLLGPAKDPAGYAVLRDPIQIGGTLHRIDNTAWRDLLAKAAR